MYKNNKIGIVVPAYNEELLILEMLDGIPEYVDSIFVINDASNDRTLELLKLQKQKDNRIFIIDHQKNKGLGQSLIDGYLESSKSDVDITAVMAGDNQMDPKDLPNILDKIIEEKFDYVKGNRLLHQEISAMPKYRFVGNSILTILTKFATGYYSLMDPQSGYTAIKNAVLRKIPIHEMTKGYGYNADILCMLNIRGFNVTDIEIRPVYDREISKIKLWKYIPKISILLTRLFFKRLFRKYIVRDFHPLIFFFIMSFILIPLGIWKGIWIFYYKYIANIAPSDAAVVFAALLLITGFQSFFFAIWFDSEYSKNK